jgi:glutamine synthetase
MNTLPPDNPFGPIGEIRFVPDPAAKVTLEQQDQGAPIDLMLCDAFTREGTPWDCCPRNALKTAIEDLKAKTGLTLLVAFEHEFTVYGLNQPNHVAFSLSAGRVIAPLADRVLSQLNAAGIALEQFQAEYGPGQFEISSVPTDPLTAADRTILTLETIRDTARGLGLRASFLPKPALDQAGNGVHIHFSLWDGGQNVTSAHDWLTPRSAPFVAGLIDAAESLIPLTCLSANSYARLRPQSWVGAYTCVGTMNREAMVRLVPRSTTAEGANPHASLEYRVTDATANVYLALAAIIRAGMAGMAAGSPAPADTRQDPETWGPEARMARGLRLLPQNLDLALTDKALAVAGDWLGPNLAAAYYSCRRNDARHAAALSFDDLATRLGLVY